MEKYLKYLCLGGIGNKKVGNLYNLNEFRKLFISGFLTNDGTRTIENTNSFDRGEYEMSILSVYLLKN